MILSIIVFIIILGLLIFSHEFGHFILAKIFRVKVIDFAFGFPPTLFSWKYKGTRYLVNAIPLGGYVKLLGEEGESQEPDSFLVKKVWERFLIVAAGVAMNFLLAILILTIGFSIGMNPIASPPETYSKEISSSVMIGFVQSGSPAQKSGIQTGDTILGFKTIPDLQNFTRAKKNEKVSLEIKRGRQIIKKEVILSSDPNAPLGVGLIEINKVKLPIHSAFLVASYETGKITGAIFKFLGIFFSKLITGKEVKEEVSQIQGPKGIFQITSQAVKLGWIFVLQIITLLSINLAIINALPFPALDGGRLLFLGAEAIGRRRMLKIEFENIIHTIGFIILIGLLMIILYRDFFLR